MAEEQKDIMQDVKNDDHQDNDSSYDDHDNVSLEPIVSNGSGVAAVGNKWEPKVGRDLCTAPVPARVMGLANSRGRGRLGVGRGRGGAGLGIGVKGLGCVGRGRALKTLR